MEQSLIMRTLPLFEEFISYNNNIYNWAYFNYIALALVNLVKELSWWEHNVWILLLQDVALSPLNIICCVLTCRLTVYLGLL